MKTLSQMTKQERSEALKAVAAEFGAKWGVTKESAAAYAEKNAKNISALITQ